MMIENNLSQEVTNITNDQTYFLPEAREKIEEALKARTYRPRNRKERRALMKKMGKDNYNDFMTVAETATKLEYIDKIQKLRELNERKKKENVDYEDSEEDD